MLQFCLILHARGLIGSYDLLAFLAWWGIAKISPSSISMSHSYSHREEFLGSISVQNVVFKYVYDVFEITTIEVKQRVTRLLSQLDKADLRDACGADNVV